jgi:tetratricopeptide (TPR) repeat protein
MIRLQKGDVEGALDDLYKAVSINQRSGEIYNNRAIARLQKGDLSGALADYEKAIALKPTLPSAFLGRGSFRYQMGDLEGALADFEKAIQLWPSYADAYVNRGLVHGLKGNVDEAITDLRKGAALNPRSIAEENRGHFTSPVMYLNQFITANPTNARAYELRGIIRLLQGQETKAELDFHKSQELDPKLKSEIDRVTKEIKQTDKQK